jgi:NADH-quinone oxidoreductase subunit N
MWSPDVYEGSPIPVTAFFALVPKAAAVAALVRFTSIIGVNATMVSIGWHGVLIVIAALTMCVGNITAIGQRSVKRMLAYSSIAHSGTIMLGALCLDGIGLNAILFYLTTYLFMTLVAFFCVSLVADHYGNDHFERFSGLIQKHPLMAVALTLAMLSLAGIPPLSGFVAKFNIINAILAKKYYMLAIITGLNSVISLYYYMKIVRLMMLKMPDDQREVSGFNFTNQATIVLLSIPILVLGIFWDNLYTFINTGKLLNY